MIITGILSLLIGYVLSKFKDDYYALGSFGFNVIIYSIFLNWQDLTRGPLGIPGIGRPSLFGFTFSDNLSFLLLAIVLGLIIYFLRFKHIIHQYYFLTKRSLTRKNEGIVGWWNLLKHVTKKRYKKGYGGYHIPLYELLESYKLKTTELNSMKEIDQCLENIK
jgi:hypothetical protein